MNYHEVTFETSFGVASQLPASDRPELAFSGKSNVGKSSMINKIFNRKRLARVSAVPGKTATINFFFAGRLCFADLPGYGYAKVSKSDKRRWAQLVESYFASQRDLRLVFQLLDIRHAPTKDDLQMVNFLIEGGFPFVIILTKADKLSKAQRERRRVEIKEELPYADQITLVEFSAKTGEGVDRIKEIIEEIEAEEIEAEKDETSEIEDEAVTDL